MPNNTAIAETASLHATFLYPDIKAITYGLFDQYLRCVRRAQPSGTLTKRG